MKQSIFITILLIVAFAIATVIFLNLPEFIQKGGPLVISLIALTIMVATFIFERIFVLRKARGKGPLPTFLKNIQQQINSGNIDAAIEACDKQRGSCANVLRTGLERYKLLKVTGSSDAKDVMEEVSHAIEESMMLEVPLLEKNLVALSTIASISTMIGLLGTVIGMIRAFYVMGAKGGVVEATELARGISEALINTAGGLIAAIAGIVAYNFFTTSVDNFTYMIDEASYSIVQSLTVKQRGH
jgi:biopolymer transport protein ExbB